MNVIVEAVGSEFTILAYLLLCLWLRFLFYQRGDKVLDMIVRLALILILFRSGCVIIQSSADFGAKLPVTVAGLELDVATLACNDLCLIVEEYAEECD